MTASLYQGSGDYQQVVGRRPQRRLGGPVRALRQGSEGPTMSDQQFMEQNERREKEDQYRYEHGSHASDNVPLGKPSF